ncbi:hypothetical protein GCM10022235_00190 [Kribbella ginsengisoli]|uniref:Uncharacterized protein n=1 Tax=Kribbella ginsengisoli TaxID=363865 RepID=A0ABP6VMA3_9ACTN
MWVQLRCELLLELVAIGLDAIVTVNGRDVVPGNAEVGKPIDDRRRIGVDDDTRFFSQLPDNAVS